MQHWKQYENKNLWHCKRIRNDTANMATTLAYIFTDADIPNDILKKLLKKMFLILLML